MNMSNILERNNKKSEVPRENGTSFLLVRNLLKNIQFF